MKTDPRPSADAIVQDIVNFFEERDVGTDVEAETDLMAAGVLDSMTLVDLTSTLQDRYPIVFESTDLVPANFVNPHRIAAVVLQKLASLK